MGIYLTALLNAMYIIRAGTMHLPERQSLKNTPILYSSYVSARNQFHYFILFNSFLNSVLHYARPTVVTLPLAICQI